VNAPAYCLQPGADCATCSMVNYGRDCANNPVPQAGNDPARPDRRGEEKPEGVLSIPEEPTVTRSVSMPEDLDRGIVEWAKRYFNGDYNAAFLDILRQYEVTR
jgi:hypothetical protein